MKTPDFDELHKEAKVWFDNFSDEGAFDSVTPEGRISATQLFLLAEIRRLLMEQNG